MRDRGLTRVRHFKLVMYRVCRRATFQRSLRNDGLSSLSRRCTIVLALTARLGHVEVSVASIRGATTEPPHYEKREGSGPPPEMTAIAVLIPMIVPSLADGWVSRRG